MLSDLFKRFKVKRDDCETTVTNSSLSGNLDRKEQITEYGVEAGDASSSSKSSLPFPKYSMESSGASTYALDQRNHWMPDSHCKECFECGTVFSTIRRRHHCRFCCRIFCYRCSNHLIEGSTIGLPGAQRACGFCAINRQMSIAGRFQTTMDCIVDKNNTENSSDSPPETRLLGLHSDNKPTTNLTNPGLTVSNSLRDPLPFHAFINRGNKNFSLKSSNSPLENNVYASQNLPSSSGLLSTNDPHSNHDYSTWHSGHRQKRINIRDHFLSCDDNGIRSSAEHFSPKKVGMRDGSDVSLSIIYSEETSHKNSGLLSWCSSQNIQTFISLWIKMTCSGSMATLASVKTDEEPNLMHTTMVASIMSKLGNLNVSLSSKSNLVMSPNNQLLTTTINSVRYASGEDIINWLIANSDGLLDSREKARALCEAYRRVSFLSPFNNKASKQFADNSTLYGIKELEQDSPPPIVNRSSSTDDSNLAMLFKTAPRPSVSLVGPSFPGSSNNYLLPRRCSFGGSVASNEPDWLTEINRTLAITPVPTDSSNPSSLTTMMQLTNAKVEKEITHTHTQLIGTAFDAATGIKEKIFASENSNPLKDSTTKENKDMVTTNTQDETAARLQEFYSTYLVRLVEQEVRDHHLPPSWVPVIDILVTVLCSDVRLNLRATLQTNLQQRRACPTPGSIGHFSLIENPYLSEFCPNKFSAMSILRYVHIKKIVQTEEFETSEILNGIAFTGHVMHKYLPQKLYQPRILLLASSITYERNLYRMTWLESYSIQEEEYLSNCVMKILSLRPTMLLIEGKISNIALNLFVKAGIVLFCNMKRAVMTRISRATGAEIVASIDTLLSGSYASQTPDPLGACQWFKMTWVPQANGTMKPVCILTTNTVKRPPISNSVGVRWFFDPTVAVTSEVDNLKKISIHTPVYTILLRGSDLTALKLAKRCLKLALLTCFNGSLESAYLSDANIIPCPQTLLKLSIDDRESVSSLESHLTGRIFNLSPFVVTNLPYLATLTGRKAPLWEFYSYLAEWPAGRRINDVWKQRALVGRARTYAAMKSASYLSLPNSDTYKTSEKQSPSFMTRRLGVQFSSVLSLSSAQKEAKDYDWPKRVLEVDDEEAYRKARSLAFEPEGVRVFKRTWTGVGRWLAQRITPKQLPTQAEKKRIELSKVGRKPQNKRLIRSIRDARSYTSIAVLRSVFSTSSASVWPEPCISSWVVSIEFYGVNDLPLGAFLERFCFRSQTCLNRECHSLIANHVQRFTQTSGCVELVQQTVDQTPTLSTDNRDFDRPPIQIWTVCPTCLSSSPPRVMSLAAWNFSFMKFLDLLINCSTKNSTDRVLSDKDVNRCRFGFCKTKYLQHCFLMNKSLATFRYRQIAIYEVCMPPIGIWVFYPPSDPQSAASYADKIANLPPIPGSISMRENTASLKDFSAVEMPDYLSHEVYATLKKFYQLIAVVKSHLVNLKHETACDDLVTLVEAFEHNLMWDCGKSVAEDRAEILAHLFNSFSSKSNSKEDEFEGVHSVSFTTSSMSSSRSSLIQGDPDFGISSKRQHVSRSSLSLPNHDLTTTEWKSELGRLFPEEKVALLFFLMYTLKRWIYNFAQDWNTRHSEYNATAKALEKANKTVGRKIHQAVSESSTNQASPPASTGGGMFKRPFQTTTHGDVSENRLTVSLSTSSLTGSFIEMENTEDGIRSKDIQQMDQLCSTSLNLRRVKTGETIRNTESGSPDLSKSVSSIQKQQTDAGNAGISASVAAVATAGVFRLLNAIRLPLTNGDVSKLCDDPWPLCEHPQLVPSASPVSQVISIQNPTTNSTESHILQPPSTWTSHHCSSSSVASSEDDLDADPCNSDQEVAEPGTGSNNQKSNVGILVANLLRLPILESTPDVYVYDSEMTSLIAYALTSEAYAGHLQNMLKHSECERLNRSSSRFESSLKTDADVSVSSPNSPRKLPNLWKRNNASSTITNREINTSDLSNQSKKFSNNLRLSMIEEGDPPASPSTIYSYSNVEISGPPPPHTNETAFSNDPFVNTKKSIKIEDNKEFNPLQVDVVEAAVEEDEKTAVDAFSFNLQARPLGLSWVASTSSGFNRDPHIQIQFSDSTTNFFCRVYYAEEFFQLRKLVFPQGENAFIRSLSRCRSWAASGGKSGSDFMKTRDDRFIVKEVSGIEMRTFHEVNRQYFDYLISAAREQRLCLLARIVGLFHVGFKNTDNGETRRLDILVMENIFHNRPGITQIYDLKGSLRGRLIAVSVEGTSKGPATAQQPNDPTNEGLRQSWGPQIADPGDTATGGASNATVPVLLDQNFINNSLENPIYIRLHSKNALMHCLNLDTQFLSDLFIMDYSLLVGVDPLTGHLVVGLIDYLRKFTLNKRLEMFVKQTITSAQGPMPTIITPEDYRERLLDQMDRNFQLVPDQWHDSLADHLETWRLPPKYRKQPTRP